LSVNSFKSGSKILLNNNEYLIRKSINFDDFELENLVYQNIEVWSKDELLNSWVNGNLIFNYNSNKPVNIKSLEDYGDNDIEIAKRRFEILRPLIEGEILPSEIKNYIHSLNGEVSKTQLYEWKKRFIENNDIRCLVPDKRGPKKSNTDEESLKIIDEVINQFSNTSEKYTVEDIYSEFLLRIDEINEFRDDSNKLKKVSKSTINRRKIAINDPHKDNIRKYGSVQANLIRDGAKEEVNVDRPLQRIEIDWTPVDVMLIDPLDLKPKRPNLVYSIDKYSGYPMGFYVTFGGVGSRAVKQCILHSIMPKTYLKELYPLVENSWDAYGIPTSIVVDNATPNESKDVEDACYQLGIHDVQFCAVGAGHQKGTIERAFRSLNTKFIHNLRGTTFSNYIEKGLYDSEGKACITLQGFIYMAHIAMVDLVANQYNSRLGDTPSEKWNNAIKNSNHKLIKLPKNILELKILLMAGTALRTICNKGIVVQNEYYQSYELMQYRAFLEKNQMSLEVRIRYDLSDMRQVFIFDRINNKYIKADPTGFNRKKIDTSLPVPFELLELDTKMKDVRKNKVDPKLRGRAKRKIRIIEKSEYKKVKNLKAEEKAEEVNSSDVTKVENVYVNYSLESKLEAAINIPHSNDEIIILDNENDVLDKKENKRKNKRLKQHITSSYEIDLEEFLDWDVKVKV